MLDRGRLALLDDPQLRAFLPLLYVAWADGDLSAGDRERIATRLDAEPWLRPLARQSIAQWLDPSAPPSAADLARVLEVVRAAAGTLDEGARRSLAAIGHAMGGDGGAPSDAAARDIAEALGIARLEGAAQGLTAPTAEPMTMTEVPIASLARALDGAHHDVRDRVRAFLDDPRKRAYGLPKEEYRELVRGWLRELGESGIGDLAFPGVTTESPDLARFMIVFEMLALGDLSLLVKSGVQLGLFGGSVYFLGTDRHHAMLGAVARTELLGCFAMSETAHGSNVADLETLARYDHATRELVIHTPNEGARKDWIGGAAHDASIATVFAQLEVGGAKHGVHAILVPLRDESGAMLPGVRAGDCGLKMGLNGVDNGRLWFDQVRVPVANLLDRFAQVDEAGNYQSPIASPSKRFFTMLGTLVGGRVCVGSAGVSVAKSALAIAVRYAVARRQFGPTGGREVPLMHYPTHQRRLLPALATTYVLALAFDRLRERFTEVMAAADPDPRELEAQAAGLKAIATWHATRTVQECREACGGQGYLAINRLPDLKADSDVFSTFEGDNTVLLQLVAKSLLTNFRKRLSDGGVGEVLRMIGQRAAVAVRSKNPIAARGSGRDHIRDRRFHLAALRYREDTLVRTVAMRMKKRIDAKMEPHDALLEMQEHLIAAAHAHVDRLALEWFEEKVARIEDADAKKWLGTLGDLHALTLLEQRAGWFLEDGFFEAPKARAIRKEAEALCREIAPASRGLVDAFAIPDACLAAPIAFFDPAHPLW